MSISERFKDLLWVFLHEYKQLLSNHGVLLIFFGGVIGYGLFYNYMYGPNTLKKVHIAVVDQANNELSREYIRMLNATEKVDVITTALTFEEAKEQLERGKVHGVVLIPRDFATNIARNIPSDIQVFCSMNSFLYYVEIAEATTFCSLALGTEITLQPATVPSAQIAPIQIMGMPLYNQDDGYGNFLIPIVMVLVLHQTLVLGIGMLAGTECEQNRYHLLIPISNKPHGLLRIVFGKALCYLSLYLVLCMFIFGLVPQLFHLPYLTSFSNIMIFSVPFLLATTFFGMSMSVFFKTYESPLLIFVFSTILLLFLSGASFPLQNMPLYWKAVHYMLPAPIASFGYIRLNSMGASISQLDREMMVLWIQAVVYMVFAIFAYHHNIRRAEKIENDLKIGDNSTF